VSERERAFVFVVQSKGDGVFAEGAWELNLK
jgi:hypothetical protein